jgi:hypothetical protein
MVTKFEYDVPGRDDRLADLQDQTAELERQLSDTRVALERELGQAAQQEPDAAIKPRTGQPGRPRTAGGGKPARGGPAHPPIDRTEQLVSGGRRTAYSPSRFRGRKLTMTAIGAALLIIVVVIASRGGPSWPASVATIQKAATTACQNPDVKSEPNQVNFACAKSTTQVLWVFALLTSGGNASYGDAKTGRIGLEPITPQQGGEIAWSLNLHNPYDASNPVDSIAVAARAINNIIGGATLTGSNGRPQVQPGLESSRANCQRYTGSAKLRTRSGYPSLCAKPVSSAAGAAALVSDVYQKWVVGASPQAAHNAAVLFENSSNPGDPQVQAILKQLPGSKPGQA